MTEKEEKAETYYKVNLCDEALNKVTQPICFSLGLSTKEILEDLKYIKAELIEIKAKLK